MRVPSWSVTGRCSSVIAARFKHSSGLLALAVAITLVGSACIHTQGEDSSDAPPPASTAVANTSRKGPSRAPSASDVPARYVITTWNASLWAPTVRSDCANRLPTRLDPRRQEGRFFVYFSCVTTGSGPQPRLQGLLSKQSASIEGALKILFRGPTVAERKAGYRATFGAATWHLPFTVAVDRDTSSRSSIWIAASLRSSFCSSPRTMWLRSCPSPDSFRGLNGSQSLSTGNRCAGRCESADSSPSVSQDARLSPASTHQAALAALETALTERARLRTSGRR